MRAFLNTRMLICVFLGFTSGLPLFTLVFGGIDYGLYFADVQTVQQATTDAARDATLSVGSSGPNWSGSTACLGPLAVSDLAKVGTNAVSSGACAP